MLSMNAFEKFFRLQHRSHVHWADEHTRYANAKATVKTTKSFCAQNVTERRTQLARIRWNRSGSNSSSSRRRSRANCRSSNTSHHARFDNCERMQQSAHGEGRDRHQRIAGKQRIESSEGRESKSDIHRKPSVPFDFSFHLHLQCVKMQILGRNFPIVSQRRQYRFE
jgi:hypothetical protein